ncbi:MAG: DUF3944 domain-containing protein [Neisseriales bacterium]|nr:MAG: DUF3944 domain-containing protein [Neisseriales bacterium]
MSYRYDRDLEFLKQISSEDLNDLVYCLTHDKDGGVRYSEELTQSEDYKKYYPNHNKYWESIAAEIQCFGANTLATLFRGGKGVLYKEVLCDVCDKLKVAYHEDFNVEKIENELLMKILSDSIKNMTPDELKKLAEEVGINHSGSITPELLLGSFQLLFRAGGFKSYQITLIIVNAVFKAMVGRGLSLGANAALTRTAAILTGPIGWLITGAWTAFDIAGAAFRVTIPAVIQIALLRKKLES